MEADAAHRAKMHEDMIEANEKQKQLKMAGAARMREEEEMFRAQMLEKFAADRRLEQMNESRRRREMQNYKKEVERLVQERRNMYEAAVAAEEDEKRKKGDQEQYRLAVVERERLRLLREHADDLKDYLPKGVLKDTRDYEMIYCEKPKQDLDRESLDFITERNKRSTINLGGRTKRHEPKGRTGGSGDWWGDGEVQVAAPRSRPSSGRRS